MLWHKKIKALRCYLLVLGWLGSLLLFLSYWQVETEIPHVSPPIMRNSDKLNHASPPLQHQDKNRLKKIMKHCNPPERIQKHTEGAVHHPYKLTGILIAFRHGDRGPLIQVRNISTIHCGHRDFDKNYYNRFLTDIKNASKENAFTNFLGPFVKYPLYPSSTMCTIGHLTSQGIAQHLTLGKILKSIYFNDMHLLNPDFKSDDVIVHCTKFRRTFQSLMAFLYAFLPSFNMTRIRLNSSKNVHFCNNDCHCEKIGYYDQKHDTEKHEYRKSHPGIIELVKKINPLIKAHALSPDITNPSVIRDVLLTYVCHNSPLPCRFNCVGIEDVSSLLSFEEWEAKQKRTTSQRRGAKLKSYGLLKSIVSYMDAMIGDEKPKVVIFSGHDKTLKSLLDSLGVPSYQAPYYASRVIFEVYQNTSSQGVTPNYKSDYHFRVIFNGKDLTKFLPFCKSVVIKQLKSGNVKKGSISLCPVETLSRYIKGDYFLEFNVNSFKAACKK
ncbi:2-phosphoxylose phosphatase 1 isoform X2 [Oratosquilla oratoria]